MKDKLVVFILTHKRYNNIKTDKVLRRQGYTGEIYYIIDNEDPTSDEYIKKYGDNVIIFDKKEIGKSIDIGNNFGKMTSTAFVRTAMFDIARKLNIKYFIQLDDDYTGFQFKFNREFKYVGDMIKNLDNIFDALLEFYKNIPAVSISIAQGGDFIGGDKGKKPKLMKLSRKCMNSFICDVDREFKFRGLLNEDVNTYVNMGSMGELFLTLNNISLSQVATQQSKGGMTEQYLDSGTYIKSFYTVMWQPSSVIVAMLNTKNKRLHHKIKWDNTVSMIIDEKYKKL